MKTKSPCLILIDKGDYEANAQAYTEVGNDHLLDNWKIHITDGVTMADKIADVWDLVKDLEWVGLLNDDHEPAVEGWDDLLIKRLDGKNFVSANDREPGARAFRLPVTATAWSMPLLKCVGWKIYPPEMKHLFIDNIWYDIGRATSCWRPVPSSIVLHKHVVFGKAPEDETHRKVYNEAAWKRDESVYHHIKNTGIFQDLVKKIKEFQNVDPREVHNPEIARKRYETLMAP